MALFDFTPRKRPLTGYYPGKAAQRTKIQVICFNPNRTFYPGMYETTGYVPAISHYHPHQGGRHTGFTAGQYRGSELVWRR